MRGAERSCCSRGSYSHLYKCFGIRESQSEDAKENMASSDRASHGFWKVSISGPGI